MTPAEACLLEAQGTEPKRPPPQSQPFPDRGSLPRVGAHLPSRRGLGPRGGHPPVFYKLKGSRAGGAVAGALAVPGVSIPRRLE